MAQQIYIYIYILLVYIYSYNFNIFQILCIHKKYPMINFNACYRSHAKYKLTQEYTNIYLYTHIILFDTKIGSILNRFSKDIHQADELLSFTLYEFLTVGGAS